MDDYGYTQEEAAERIGKARPTVANLLRLMELSEPVQKLVESGNLSAGPFHRRGKRVVVKLLSRLIDIGVDIG